MKDKQAAYAKYQVILKSSAPRPETGSRTAKIEALRETAAEARQELIGWIRDHNMAEQVVEVSESNAFNILYVVSAPSAARKLRGAPNVASVSPAGESGVELALSTR